MTGAGFGVAVGVLAAGEAAVSAEPAPDGAAGAVEVHDTPTTRIATKAKRTPFPEREVIPDNHVRHGLHTGNVVVGAVVDPERSRYVPSHARLFADLGNVHH